MQLVQGSGWHDLAPGDIQLVCVGRNMAYYIDYMMDYYSRLGVASFVYIDNCSDDNSLEILAKWKSCIVVQTGASFKDYQSEIRYISATQFAGAGWRLAIDPDEILDISGIHSGDVKSYIASCADRNISGAVAQMLEMVPAKSIGISDLTSFEDAQDLFCSYSVSEIEAYGYFDKAMPFSGLIKGNSAVGGIFPEWKFGGLRRQLFGEFCCLTKHPVFYYKQGVVPLIHPHFTSGLNLADETLLLKHYKFSGDFYQREARFVDEHRLSHDEAALRVSKIAQSDGISFENISDLQRLDCVDQLYESGFLSRQKRAV